MNENEIEVRASINAPIEKVWSYYNEPEHITKWAFADDTWEAPHAENDLRTGGRFLTRMQSKDGKEGFDFSGTYDEVKEHELIRYTMDGEDKRKVSVRFTPEGENTLVTVRFDMEHENSRELQVQGWQAILNNFKKHVETT
jgi:uncharacterized protein YndB with AHSA1/START domain